MLNLNRNDFLAMREGLAQLRIDAAAFSQAANHILEPQSQAYADLRSCSDSQTFYTLWGQGALQIEAASDHLSAFVKTISEPVETISPWTCVRMILESSALAGWMFDPKINFKERIARSFAHRYMGLQEQVKFGMAAGIADVERARKRIDDVERGALSLGYPAIVGPTFPPKTGPFKSGVRSDINTNGGLKKWRKGTPKSK